MNNPTYVFIHKKIFNGTPHKACDKGNIEAVKQHLAAGTDVNAKDVVGKTLLDLTNPETAGLLRKHGGKASEELTAEGK